jgi:hypothetical protein
MSPKEKSLKLIGKFYVTIYHTIHQEQKAKECALIAVDEIIKEIDDNYDTLHSADRKQYWQEVKKEIDDNTNNTRNP